MRRQNARKLLNADEGLVTWRESACVEKMENAFVQAYSAMKTQVQSKLHDQLLVSSKALPTLVWKQGLSKDSSLAIITKAAKPLISGPAASQVRTGLLTLQKDHECSQHTQETMLNDHDPHKFAVSSLVASFLL